MINVNSVKMGLVLQLISVSAMAQSIPPSVERGINGHVSVVGALKYPGIKFGADYLIIQKEIEKIKRNDRTKNIYKNRYITTNLGVYYHKDYNANFFLQAGYQWQRMRSSGWFTALEPQLGVSRTFIDGAVYKVSEEGNISRKKAAGHFYVAPALSFAVGKDLSLKNNTPLTLFSKVTLFTNLPYNNFVYGRTLLEIGASYHFAGILKHTVNTKHIKK
jgi:hypothetical protein